MFIDRAKILVRSGAGGNGADQERIKLRKSMK